MKTAAFLAGYNTALAMILVYMVLTRRGLR
jgi:hypothetical protein